ncbi:MAG: DNA polymerase III subunit chi [Pseudomonadota bacterium]
MTEILFYHLTERTMEQVLPGLVEKSLERGWKAVIHTGNPERLEAINSLLWTFRDGSFLPHGHIRDGTENLQPVWLTAQDDNPNGAAIRFLVDGAQLDDGANYDRLVYMFDGHDNASVEHARGRWTFHKEQEDVEQTYWQQNANGGWEKKA